jgi:hypothetical protein
VRRAASRSSPVQGGVLGRNITESSHAHATDPSARRRSVWAAREGRDSAKLRHDQKLQEEAHTSEAVPTPGSHTESGVQAQTQAHEKMVGTSNLKERIACITVAFNCSPFSTDQRWSNPDSESSYPFMWRGRLGGPLVHHRGLREAEVERGDELNLNPAGNCNRHVLSKETSYGSCLSPPAYCH